MSEVVRSDQYRLRKLTGNLKIRFVNCTFTYKDVHFDQKYTTSLRSHSKMATKFKNKILNPIEGTIREAISYEKTFSNCLFVPANEKNQMKSFIRVKYSGIPLSFEDCKFVKRSSSLPEQITRRLRHIFGLIFDFEYISSTATIKDYTFRGKDINFAMQHIQERIVEEA